MDACATALKVQLVLTKDWLFEQMTTWCKNSTLRYVLGGMCCSSES